MPRSAAVGFLVVLACGLALVVIGGIRHTRVDHQRLGVLAAVPVANLKARDVACEERVGLAAPVSRIGFDADASHPPSPALDIWMRTTRGRRVLTRGRLNPGWGGGALVLKVPTADADQLVDVCFRNTGPYRVQLFGDVPGRAVAHVAPANLLTVNGRPVPGALSLRFVRGRPATLLSLIPDMLRHAAVLRPFGAWGMWVLLVAVLLGLPVLAWRALRSALSAGPGPA
jgi:hypothetical protein